MKQIRNEKGIALVLVLVLAMIALAIVSAMLFMLTSGTKLSGAMKAYRTADEASYGGSAIITELIKNRDVLNKDAIAVGMWRSKDACFKEKISKSTADWGAACGDIEKSLSIDSKVANTFDVSFTLGNSPSFNVFGKIVDTVEGNSDTGGLVTEGELGGAGTVNSNSGLVNPPHQPYLYRLEVQAQATANPKERTRLSVLYAY
jgi:hypothetical protein